MKNKTWRRMLFCAALAMPGIASALDGVVVDASTREPIAQAHVVSGEAILRTDERGRFKLPAASGEQAVSARAPGYRRAQRTVAASGSAPVTLELQPFKPKAVYLSVYGIGSAVLRGDALRLMEKTELNALVIDVKGDRSLVPYRSAAMANAGLTQPFVTVSDMPAMVRSLREKGLYLIARVVVFKDDRLAAAKPEWAVRDEQGHLWRDREQLMWVDPSRPEVWQHPIALAEEAAQLGFDEIQFDYVRFPDTRGLRFSKPNTMENRTASIAGFLDAARQRLARYNVFVSADIFGYVCWNTNDTDIGQQLGTFLDRVDYLSPMLYPSGFTWGIPGHRMAVGSPYEIVHRSLQEALRRTKVPGVRFRPWLQSFRDYAFDRRAFGEHEIRAQIKASEAVDSHGWMLWNASNRYVEAGLRPRVEKPAIDNTLRADRD